MNIDDEAEEVIDKKADINPCQIANNCHEHFNRLNLIAFSLQWF